MDELKATAERFRKVENATHNFLMRWAVDELMNELAGGERIHRDITHALENFSFSEQTFSHYRPGLDD